MQLPPATRPAATRPVEARRRSAPFVEKESEPALLLVELAAGLVKRGGELAELANLVVKLRDGRSGSLRDGLSQALGDPTLEVG